MTEVQVDVAIIGSGLVGLTLGKALAREGLSVALIDNKPPLDEAKLPPLFEQRAIVLSENSCDILRSFDLDGCIKDAAKIKRVLVSEKGSFGKLRFDADMSPFDNLASVVKAFKLAISMRNSCLKEKNIKEYRPATVTSIDFEKNCLELNQGASRIKASLIVAADGARSTLVDLVGLARDEKHYEQSAVISNLKISGDHKGCAIERFLPTGPLAFLPVGAREVAMVWCTEKEEAKRVMALDKPEFLAAIQDAFGFRFGRFVDASPVHSHPLTSSFVEKQSEERILVLGNAAHSLHPVAGQGFNLSIRDITVLIGHIKACKGRLDDLGFIKQYALERESAQKSMALISDTLPRIFLEPYRPFKKIRSAALMACDLVTPLNRTLTELFLGLRDNKSSILLKVFE